MKNSRFKIDWQLLLPALFLVILGLTILFSINPSFFKSQLFALIFSLFIFFFFSQVDYSLLKEFSGVIYGISLALLFIVLVIGLESHGAVRWIDIFGVRLQFSEILKPFLAISLSAFLTTYDTLTKKTFFLVFLFLGPIAGLIYLQPDLGNALIYVGVTLVTLAVFGIPFFWFLWIFIPLLVTSPFIYSRLKVYQRQRLLTFLHPNAEATTNGYNVIQAIIAVGSGKFLGKGLNEGTQSALRFLPENHTDFIFATLSERLGFMGSMLVVVLFLYLFYRIYIVFRRVETLFEKVFVAAAFSLLIIHFFVNIGMNVGLMPIVGITLPFVSFGGSSLLSNFILLGILSSISVASRKQDVLQIQ